MPEELDRWRTATEAADYLAISEATLQRWVAVKGMPVHRVGRTLRFKLSEIDAWVRSGKNSPVDAGPARRGVNE